MDTPTQSLTERQIGLLKAIIEEFIATAQPVGSETLEKKYSIGISPATIRNEMARLSTMGFLTQPHTSAGRSPTPEALKYYVDHLMKPKDMSVAEEVAVKEKIWDYRQTGDKLLREATRALADKTRAMAFTATNGGDLYYSGAANILDMPEFYDYELTHDLLATFDKFEFWWNILEQQEDAFDILLGDDVRPRGVLGQCGVVYAKFTTPHLSGAIGVVGPFRLNYSTVIPIVRYMGNLIGEVGGSWT